MGKYGKNEGSADSCDDPHGLVESIREDEEICRSKQLRHIDQSMLVDRMEAVESEIAGSDVVEEIVQWRYYRTCEYSSEKVLIRTIVRSV